ncbi:MerR family DNA-binding transcriptional regulator [Scytonema sp. HK-05]
MGWKVGEFAKLVGVSTSTLRRWESPAGLSRIKPTHLGKGHGRLG